MDGEGKKTKKYWR